MITEDQLEQLAIQWFQDTGWNYVHGAVIAPEGVAAEREDFRAVVLKGRLAEAVRRLNPKLPESAVEEVVHVVHVVTKPEHISLAANNREFHRMLINGVRVEYAKHMRDALPGASFKQILDNAVKAEDVQDIFKMAGLERPNIGLLSDEFLEDVRRMEKKNLAVELLERLLQHKIKAQTRTNLVQEKKYSDRLIEALRKYHNRMIESSQVIEEMIQMAKDMQAAMKRHEELGLNLDEEAFYDALADRPEVLLSMGDATLKKLASELTEKLRNSTTVDWQFRESVRAKMRILIRQLLRKYKYPPEGCEEAIALVLAQAQALADDWSAL